MLKCVVNTGHGNLLTTFVPLMYHDCQDDCTFKGDILMNGIRSRWPVQSRGLERNLWRTSKHQEVGPGGTRCPSSRRAMQPPWKDIQAMSRWLNLALCLYFHCFGSSVPVCTTNISTRACACVVSCGRDVLERDNETPNSLQLWFLM